MPDLVQPVQVFIENIRQGGIEHVYPGVSAQRRLDRVNHHEIVVTDILVQQRRDALHERMIGGAVSAAEYGDDLFIRLEVAQNGRQV